MSGIEAVKYLAAERFMVGKTYPGYHLPSAVYVPGQKLPGDLRIFPRDAVVGFQFCDITVVERGRYRLGGKFGRKSVTAVRLQGEAALEGYANSQKINLLLALMPQGFLHDLVLPSHLEHGNVVGYTFNKLKKREEDFVIRSWNVPLSNQSLEAQESRRIYNHVIHAERARRLRSAPSFSY